jgi:hypothetical protein
MGSVTTDQTVYNIASHSIKPLNTNMAQMKKAMIIRVALCQFNSHQPQTTITTTTTTTTTTTINTFLQEHETKNLEKAREFIAQAAKQRANLIIFPEYVLTITTIIIIKRKQIS